MGHKRHAGIPEQLPQNKVMGYPTKTIPAVGGMGTCAGATQHAYENGAEMILPRISSIALIVAFVNRIIVDCKGPPWCCSQAMCTADIALSIIRPTKSLDPQNHHENFMYKSVGQPPMNVASDPPASSVVAGHCKQI